MILELCCICEQPFKEGNSDPRVGPLLVGDRVARYTGQAWHVDCIDQVKHLADQIPRLRDERDHLRNEVVQLRGDLECDWEPMATELTQRRRWRCRRCRRESEAPVHAYFSPCEGNFTNATG